MSVNYYAFGPFPDGEAEGEGLHIGQYASVHRFLLRAHPDRGLTSLAAWMDFLRQPHVVIRAEHGRQLSVDEMEKTIREREDGRGWPRKARFGVRRSRGSLRSGEMVDAEGFELYAGEFC